MGTEYKIGFTHPGRESVVAVLRRLPMVHEVSAVEGKFELRAEQNKGVMPDAMVGVEPYGLYYCDFGGAGREFLGLVITWLVSKFGPVTIADLE